MMSSVICALAALPVAGERPPDQKANESGGKEGAPRIVFDERHDVRHHSIDVVLNRFALGHGILPVVSRGDARRVDGVITLDSVARFMNRHVTI